MKKLIALALILYCSSVVYASMTEKIIVLKAGETIDLKNEVPWPVAVAWAYYDPPADRGGFVSPFTSFCEDSAPVIVHGPTTITLKYGSLDIPIATESIESSPDAIGGGE